MGAPFCDFKTGFRALKLPFGQRQAEGPKMRRFALIEAGLVSLAILEYNKADISQVTLC